MFRAACVLIISGVVIFEACFSGNGKYEAIRVRGSDSEVNLIQALAESFMDIDSTTSVGVTGGGSGVGISALINDKTDIANSSRPITQEELYYAEKRGVSPFPIVFALDALAIIVHEDNPVDSLTLEELGRLYSGQINNWQVVNGRDASVTLYGRQSSSGTYIYFRDEVVNSEYSRSIIGMNGTAQIVDAVRSDKTGVGYVSSGYLSDHVMRTIKVISIKADSSSKAYYPLNREHILAGHYPITRSLLQYTNGKPKGKLLDFILYQFSPQGTGIIESNGFYAVSSDSIRNALLN